MTLKKISEIANVSISTVSRALANSPSISNAVRDRVINIAEEIGYLDKRNNKILSPAILRSILFVTPKQMIIKGDENLVSFPLINQLKKDCEEQNIQIFSVISGDSKIRVNDIKYALKKNKVDAIIVIQDDSISLINYLKKLSIPAVLINGEDISMSIDTVTISNRFAAMTATQYLLGLGHRHILHLTWDGRITITRRKDGYKDALRANNIAIDEELILYSKGNTSNDAKDMMQKWLKKNPDFKNITAIFCASDQFAIGAIEALKEYGMSIPNDVSVLGFDDMLPLGIYDPPLSTIHAPFLSLPQEALNILKERIYNPNRPVVRVEVGCYLKERSSVAPPPKNKVYL